MLLDLPSRLRNVLNGLHPLIAKEGAPGRTLRQRMQEEGISGVQCGIALAARERYDAAIENSGTNDLGIPVSTDTVSQCASLSKPVAAAWIIEHCVKHKIDIQRTPLNSLIEHSIKAGANDHFHGWRVHASDGKPLDIPIARFLSHTSGVGGHYVFGCAQDKAAQSALSILRGEIIKGAPEQSKFEFRAAPGAEMNYSGTSYILIELLIEQLCGGRPFHQIMSEYLIGLGMLDSTFDHAEVLKKTMLHSKYLRFPGAAAGMYTTTADFMLFVKAIIDAWHGRSSALSRETARIMLTPAMNQREFIGLDPGHGFFVLENPDRSITFAHQGANENFRVLVIANTAGQIAYSVTNSDLGTPLNCEIVRGLMQELRFPGYSTKVVPAIAVAPEKLSVLRGVYEVPKRGTITLALDSQNNLVREYNEHSTALHPANSDGTAFIHSTTGKKYTINADGSLSLSDINGASHRALKSPAAAGPLFDDRSYNLDDPAKLVNLQIRDALALGARTI